MVEIKSPGNSQELVVWIDTQLSQIIGNDDRWPYSSYCEVISAARRHVRLLCKKHLPLIPEQEVFACVGEKKTARLKESTVEEFQDLRNAIDPDSAEGPIANNQIRVNGEVYPVAGAKPWGVLDYMWPRETAEQESIIEHVWGHDYDRISIKGAVSRANEALLGAKYPRKLRCKGRKIIWK